VKAKLRPFFVSADKNAIKRKLRHILQNYPLYLLIFILTGCSVISQTQDKSVAIEPDEIIWYESYAEAYEVASAQNKPMMLVFYGTSSNRLDKRTFSKPDVIKLAQNFVSLKIGADQDELIQKYKIQEFPTVVFADSRGGEYDKFLGYKSWQSFVEILRTALIPLEVEYSLIIDTPRSESARLKCVFKNIRWKSLILMMREDQSRISNIFYNSTDGQPGWEEVEKNQWLMKFNTDSMKTVTIEYEADINVISDNSYQPEYVSYMDDEYGVFDGRALFLIPQDFHMVSEVNVNLNVPLGWEVLTPWQKGDNLSFTAESVEEVVDSVFCMGQFQFAKRDLREHEVFAILCGGEGNGSRLERRADEMVEIFEDYITRFGDFPFRRYLAVFTEKTPDGRYITGSSAHVVGFSGPLAVDHSYIAHEIFHVWNGGIIDQETYYEGWFKEGFTQYYGYLTPYRLGFYSRDRFLRFLKRDYEDYLSRYGTRDDMALTNVKEELARQEGHRQLDSARLWNMYYKGALVASLMDKEIRDRTEGMKSLDDLMHHIFQRFRSEKYSSDDILVSLNKVTGSDFSDFFSDFVYAKSKLPPVDSYVDFLD
jgi:predicted metalloprotease with PDZ domain/thioredoxin-related protein